MKIKEKVIRIKEECPWCNKKTLGKDELGFIACVSCEYNSYYQRGKHSYLDYSEAIDRSWNIYKELNCPASNPQVNFGCCCSKLKGHKGVHRDKEHPDFTWEDEPSQDRGGKNG